MQSQQNKFHIFLSHILINMHFPNLAKTWIKYNCTEKLLKHDMQPYHVIDLETENTPKFIHEFWSYGSQDMEFRIFKPFSGKTLKRKNDLKR